MPRKLDAVAAGHICLDISPVFPDSTPPNIGQIFKPGKLVNMDPAFISLGGPVSNTGLALQHYGLQIAAIAGIGDDTFGSLLVQLLEERGVQCDIQPSAGEATSYTVVLAPPGIDRIFLHCPGKNNTFQASDIDFSTVEDARLFHLGYPPLMRTLYSNEGEQLVSVFEKAKASGATTSLDMSLPDPASESGQVAWENVLEKLLPHVDIFMPSIEEIFFMLEKEEYLRLRAEHPDADLVEKVPVERYPALAEKALGLGCGICVIKTARRGYYLRGGKSERLAAFCPEAPAPAERWAGREIWAPAFKVPKILSATGSGDSSIAGFLTAFLRGLPPEECMRLANASGHHNLTAFDALSGLPSWQGLSDFLQKDPKKEDPLLDGTSFAFDVAQQVYFGEKDGQ